MSRIDEALRRIQGDSADGKSPDDGQHKFLPAWTVNQPEAVQAMPGVTIDHADTTRSPAKRRLLDSAPKSIVRFSSEWRERLAGGPEADPHVTEQFRRLAATLHHARLNSGLSNVMVTSALSGDGKTLTSINLALVLAESYRYNVLLVDADLRRPSIANVVELGHGSGLSEALRAPTDQKLALVSMTPRLTLLPAGQPIANSIEALTSPRMAQILEEASGRFDWVILDGPPVGLTADARLLAQMAGGTLLVIRAGRTPYSDVQKAVEAIGREQILGVVLNDVETGSDRPEYRYGTREP